MTDENPAGRWCQTGDLRWFVTETGERILQQRYVLRPYGLSQDIEDEEWRALPVVGATDPASSPADSTAEHP